MVKISKNKIINKIINILFIFLLACFTYQVYLETGFYTSILSIYFNIRMWYAKEVIKTAAIVFRKAKNIKQI